MTGLKEKMKVVMVPAKASSIKFVKKGEYDNNEDGKLVEMKEPKLLFVEPTEFGYPSMFLCICSDREIKNGDWLYNEYTNTLFQHNFYIDGIMRPILGAVKVEASTDKSLGLPSPSIEFIRKYVENFNKGTPIDKVLVEMESGCGYQSLMCPCGAAGSVAEECKSTFFETKVNSKNEISISKIQETWDDIMTECDIRFPYQKMVFDYLKQNYNVPTKLK